MEQILSFILGLPSVMLAAIFGALGAAVSWPIGEFVSKKFNSKKIGQALYIGIPVLFVLTSDQIATYLKPGQQAKQVMSELKNQRIFATIFRLHPEAEHKLETHLETIIRNSSADQVSSRAQIVGAEWVSNYLNMYLKSASDAVIYKLLQRNIAVLRTLRNKPEQCAGYYLGKPKFKKGDVTKEFVIEESNIKADIIESAVNNPSSIRKPASVDELVQIIARAYKKKGYDPNNLQKVAMAGNLPPAEVCRIGTELSDVLASLGPRQAAFVYKSLMSLPAQK